MIPEIINLSETATPACPQCGARTVEEACTLGCKGEGMDNREIVETLATRVMGWHAEKTASNGTVLQWADSGKLVVLWRTATVFACLVANCSWDPLTDPAASKQLRDKMRESGWLLSVVDCKLLADDPLQVKARVRKFGSPDSYASEADTEEMAVALACLKAVEGK